MAAPGWRPHSLRRPVAVSEATLALFGTSADPPTLGHRALLEGLADHYGEVATWASDNPLKQHGAPLELRAQMLNTLICSLNNPQIHLEQELSHRWAIETMQRAAERWPERSLVFVVGGDLAGQIPQWHRAQELLQSFRLAVVPRRGYPLDPQALETLRQLGAELEVLELSIPASASSEVRQQPQRDTIPEVIWRELLKHNLYGLGQQAQHAPR